MSFAQAARTAAHVAARLLGWRPDEFWRATPAELLTALGLDTPGGEPVDAVKLRRLMEVFPDDGR